MEHIMWSLRGAGTKIHGTITSVSFGHFTRGERCGGGDGESDDWRLSLVAWGRLLWHGGKYIDYRSRILCFDRSGWLLFVLNSILGDASPKIRRLMNMACTLRSERHFDVWNGCSASLLNTDICMDVEHITYFSTYILCILRVVLQQYAGSNLPTGSRSGKCSSPVIHGNTINRCGDPLDIYMASLSQERQGEGWFISDLYTFNYYVCTCLKASGRSGWPRLIHTSLVNI